MDRMYIDSQSSSFYNDMLKKCGKKGELWLLVSIIGVYKKVVSIMKIVF